MVRLAVARLWFCSNSFSPQRTRGDDLQTIDGAAPIVSGADDELAGLRNFVAGRPDWDVTVLRCASAPAGGPLSAEAFGTWMAAVEDGLRRGRFDGVYLSLHGACQAEGDPAADLTILRRMRSVIGHTPLVASFDLRANLSEEVAILLDGATCNRAWPTGGGADAAIRALSLLDGIMSKRFRPVGVLARVPFVMPDLAMGEALRDIWNGSLKSLPAPVLDASVFGGFAWGDSPYAGPSALVWTDRDAGAAREMAARLAVELTRPRLRMMPVLAMPDVALATVAQDTARTKPAILIDVGDDPVCGGLCDTPDMLRALLSENLGGRALFAALYDPDAVAAAFAAGPGGSVARGFGARFTRLYGNALALETTVQAVGDVDGVGLYAILRTHSVDIVVTQFRPTAITPDWFAARAIDCSGYVCIAIKGGAVTRMAYLAEKAECVLCDCPGPTVPDLLRLRFHYVPAARRASPNDPRMSQQAEPAWAGRGLRTPPIRSGLDHTGADQAYHRHEDRRGNAQYKRSEALGA
jgi:microcystin degradation protein MlrC